MERLFLMFLDHTQRRSTVGEHDLETSRIGAPYIYIYMYIYDIINLKIKSCTKEICTKSEQASN